MGCPRGETGSLAGFNPIKDKLDLSAMRPLLNEKESQVSWADLFVRDVDTFSPDRSYLVFNSAQKTWRIGAQELKAAQSSHVSIMKMLRS